MWFKMLLYTYNIMYNMNVSCFLPVWLSREDEVKEKINSLLELLKLSLLYSF